MAFNFRKLFGKEESSEDYIEIDLDQGVERKEKIKYAPLSYANTMMLMKS